jgi:hypothetical protein
MIWSRCVSLILNDIVVVPGVIDCLEFQAVLSNVPKGPTTSTDTRQAPSLHMARGLKMAVGTEVGTAVGAEMASGSTLEAMLGSRGWDWTRTGRVCSGSNGIDLNGVRGSIQRKESPGHGSLFVVDDSVCCNVASSRNGYYGWEGPNAKNSGATSMEASRTLSRRRRRPSGVINLSLKGLKGRG